MSIMNKQTFYNIIINRQLYSNEEAKKGRAWEGQHEPVSFCMDSGNVEIDGNFLKDNAIIPYTFLLLLKYE